MIKRYAAMALVGALTLLFGSSMHTSSAWAKSSAKVNTIGKPGVVIKGYDPVAYFVAGKPQKGSTKYSVKRDGAEWRFASAENKAKFLANPAKYTPAYGGYCAYGVAQGVLVKIEPQNWTIRDGKLYLNYDDDVQADWNKDPAGYIKTADKKWPKLVK